MANYWPAVLLDLQSAIATVWPEIGLQFEVVIAKKVNWYNLYQNKELSNQYVVLQIVPSGLGQDYGSANTLFTLPVKMFYIELDPGSGVVLDLLGKLKLMQDYLLSFPFASIEVLGYDFLLDAGEDQGATVMFDANMPMTVASISFACIVGEYSLL